MSKMNEAVRMQYLDAMGVDMFVPRKHLPNIPVPKRCVLPQKSSLTMQSSSAIASTITTTEKALHSVLSSLDNRSTHQRPASDAQDVVAQPPLSEVIDSVASTVSVKQASHNTGDENDTSITPFKSDAEFTLGLWFTEEGVHCINSIHTDDALPTATLLSNMLMATGVRKHILAEPEIQRWPLASQTLVDTSWSAAQAMMHDFIDARCQQSPMNTMLLFGDDAVRVMFNEEYDVHDKLFTIQYAQTLEVPCLILPSLRDILYQPELKAKVWQALLTIIHNDK